MTNRNQIIAKIEALEIQFKAMPCDNNGNPCDWKQYDRLLTSIEVCEALLDGKVIEVGGNIERI
tara:strand:+ start:1530 stop:1721 length:192 start_codon:yes stop_codon:yes gene_type:complete